LSTPIKYHGIQESTLIWAIVASILLHLLIVNVVPKFKIEPIKKANDILRVEIQKQKKPEPVAKPLPPKIEPKKVPEPVKKNLDNKPTVNRTIIKNVDLPSPKKEESSPPPQPVDNAPHIIAAEPKISEITPHEVITPPQPSIEKPKAEISQADIDSAIGDYSGQIGRAIAKFKQYPLIAIKRGWQGDLKLDLKLDGDGNVLSAKIQGEGSGHEALDKQALDMIKKAAPFPLPPQALRNRTFNITVPVSFKLEPV
jgi:protein TonB